MKKGNYTKYLIFVIAVAATIFVWISLMKAQDIPAPMFQGFLFTLLIFSISWFVIKKLNNETLQIENIEEYLMSNGFKNGSISSSESEIYSKDDITFEIFHLSNSLEANKKFNEIRVQLANKKLYARREEVKKSGRINMYSLELADEYICILCSNKTVIFTTSNIESKIVVEELLKA